MPMRWFVLIMLVLTLSAPAAQAQQATPGRVQSPVLIIDTDRLYTDSQFGIATAQEFETRGAELGAENRRIEAELTAEEKALTERRPSLEPAEFRTLADAFDEKVQATRRTQDAKTRALNQDLEKRRVTFLNATAPVLEDLMRASGAAVILDRRSVFLSATAVDITDDAIERLDAVLGDGSTMVPNPEK